MNQFRQLGFETLNHQKVVENSRLLNLSHGSQDHPRHLPESGGKDRNQRKAQTLNKSYDHGHKARREAAAQAASKLEERRRKKEMVEQEIRKLN
jgi:hypothetical protein